MGAKLRKKIRSLAHICIKYVELDKFYLIYILFLLAVVTGQYSVGYMEMGSHGFVVGDALRVVALHDAFNLVGSYNASLLNHLVVADDAENHIWSYHRKTGDLIIGKELVAYLDDTFATNLLRWVVETDSHGCLKVEKP